MPRTLTRVGVLLLCFVLVACGPTPPQGTATAPAGGATSEATAPATATGGTLRVGALAAPDSLNPGAAYLVEAFNIFDIVYDTLIRIDLKGQAYPGLAKTWSVGSDGRTWTFQLHEGAVWHDGQPLTAEDVKFTYEMIQGFESFALLKDFTDMVETVEAPDPTTVVLTFSEPVADTDERFSSIYILPKHIWSAFPDATAAAAFENSELIGSGPFKLAEYRPGEFTRLTAVKDHYATPPKLDEIIFRVFGNNDAMVQAFRIGELDLMGVASNTVVRTLQAEPNIKVEMGNQRALTNIIFNVVEPANCPPEVGKCTGHPALRDVRVRQALAHATDKQGLIDGILLGLGTPGLTLVTPAHGEFFDRQIEDYAFDPARANQILDEAGYADSDGDGVRELPGDPSRPLNFRYSYPSDQSADGQRFYELLRDMWRQAGVVITLTPLDADALTSVCCPAYDYDVINWGLGAGVDPGSLLVIPTTDQIVTGVSESGYANPEYDQLYQEQRTTVDRAQRLELINEMQGILVRDLPYLIPYYRQAIAAHRTDSLQGWVVEPDGVLNMLNRISLVQLTPVP